MEAWAALSFKLIRPCVFVFVYFYFGFSDLLSRAYFWVPLRCIFIGNSFRFCIKLCLFAYFSLNYYVWASFTLAYFRTLALVWPSFCFIKFSSLCKEVLYIEYGILFKIVSICLDLCKFFCECVPYFSYFCLI